MDRTAEIAFIQHAFESAAGRLGPLLMDDGCLDAAPHARSADLLRLGNGQRERLFDEHVNASSGRDKRQRGMGRRRRANADNLDPSLADGGFGFRKNRHTEQLRGTHVRVEVGVRHRDQPGVRHRSQLLRMPAADPTAAKNGKPTGVVTPFV